MDKLTPEQRSRTMRRIRSRDTKPEMLVRRFLYAQGFRYRVNVRTLPGKPDIALRKYGVAIFVHGCFWHGHECQHGRMPQTNTDFWRRKIERNMSRDAEVRERLRALGWRTMVVWECQLKPKCRQQTLTEVADLLRKAFVERHRPKGYALPHEADGLLVAAEPAAGYSASSPNGK